MALNEQDKIITKSYARSHLSGVIIFDEMCCICDRNIPEGKLVLRYRVNNRVICLLCIVAIAEVD